MMRGCEDSQKDGAEVWFYGGLVFLRKIELITNRRKKK
jgi:hypothetical protein